MILSKKIILGTANFNQNYGLLNNKLSKKKAKSLLSFARIKKIKYLETSRDYRDLNFIPKKNLNYFCLYKKIDVSDKYFLNGNTENKLIKYLFMKDGSRCYGVILRNPNFLLKKKNKKIFNILKKLQKKKLITEIGITIYDTKNLKKIVNIFRIDFIQLPYNFLNYKILQRTKKIVMNKKIEIHVRSIFLQGLLLKKAKSLPPVLSKLKKYWIMIDKYLNYINLNRYSACLNFALNSGADKIVLGANNKNQLKEIFKTRFVNFTLPKFIVREKKLIDPIYWLELKKNVDSKS
jgi:predicted aldo/keto reductase-like oxidoreductase